MNTLVGHFVGYVLMPVFQTLMWLASFSNEKIRKGISSRKNKPWLKSDQDTKPIIVHCSSGEFEYAKPLIRELKSQYPQIPIHVSYFSPTYQKNIQSTAEVDFSYPSPWETPGVVDEFLRYHKPRAYFISRTDAWPVMLSRCKRQQIPTALFSATISKNSKRLSNPLSRWLSRWILKQIDFIYCVTHEDQKMFARLGLESQVMGDSRYDQVLYRIAHPKPLKNELKPGPSENVIVCGSTWKEDEIVLVEAAKGMKEQTRPQTGIKPWRWVFAPHEPNEKHLSLLIAKLKESNLSYQLYSTAREWTTDVLVIDQVGILADLYSWGTAAFVGGSFKKTVHSVMEPLAQGCWTFVGPRHENNREAVIFQSKDVNGLTAVRMILDAEELAEDLTELKPSRPEITSLVRAESGATVRLIENLISKLPDLRIVG